MKKIAKNKASNTIVKTIEKKYGVSLGYSSDLQLEKALKKEGTPTLSKLLKKLGAAV